MLYLNFNPINQILHLKNTITFFFILVGSIWATYSQVSSKYNKSLKESFFELEKKYSVKFSFADEIVFNKTLTKTLNKKTLKENLLIISNELNLEFKKITNRYYTVSARSKTNINICGHIYGSLNKLPLSQATVSIKGKILGTATNNKGYFNLKNLNYNDSLKISYVGYKTIIKPIIFFKSQRCPSIYLKESSSILSEVIVNDRLSSGIKIAESGSIELSFQKIKALSGLTEPDIFQTIQLLPGIVSPSESLSELQIRGGNADHNLVLFDGIKIYNSSHFFGAISAFNPHIVDNVSIYKSGTSAKYGNHISGVIDIQTNDTIAKKTSGGFGLNLIQADAFLKTPISSKTSLNIAARRSIIDVFNLGPFDKLANKSFQNTKISDDQNNTSPTSVNRSNSRFIDYNMKFNYSPSKKDQFSINHLYTKNNLNHFFNENPEDIKAFNRTSIFNIENYGANFKWWHKWSKNLQHTITSSYSKYNLSTDNFDNDNINEFQSFQKRNSIRDLNFRINFEQKLNSKNTLRYGYEYENNNFYNSVYEIDYDGIERPNNFILNNTNNYHSLYSEYAYNTNKFNISFGSRFSYNSFSNSYAFSPRAYIDLLLFKNITLRSSIEYKNQNFIKVKENRSTFFRLENSIYLLTGGKNDIAIPKSLQFSLGLVILNKNKWVIDIDTYYKIIKDYTTLSNGFNIEFDRYDVGKSVSKGIEFSIKKEWKKYNMWLGYTISETNLTFPNINNGKPFTGNFDITQNLTWLHNLQLGAFDFSLSYSYRTGIPFSEVGGADNNNFLIYLSERNSKRLADYQRLDFSTFYNFSFDYLQKWKAKLGISLWNLTNQKNTISRTFLYTRAPVGQAEFFQSDIIGHSLVPNLVFRVNF
ncbi:conserved hypothetical protein [Tenacibaculum sp. 190524A02b]|uniref:TonB-dependent receptor plug domain-containing protein n=1 Tax=Tenacibaculum vairaonense TaxID=3137860 RepID=A0ABM9PRU4_9FLAO